MPNSDKSWTKVTRKQKSQLFSAVVKAPSLPEGSDQQHPIIKELLAKVVPPTDLEVKRSCTLKSGDLQLSFATKERRDNFIKRVNQSGQLNAKPRQVGENFIIKGVICELEPTEVIDFIMFSSNISGPTSAHIKPAFLKRNRCEFLNNHVISALSRKMINFLRENSKITIGYQRVAVEPLITQCFKCHHFGHTSKSCTSPVACGYCGSGHRTSTCPNKKDKNQFRCIHCPKSTDLHCSMDRSCPVYKRMTEQH